MKPLSTCTSGRLGRPTADSGSRGGCTLIRSLSSAGEALRSAYFPIDSFISLVSVIGGSPGVEVGMVGSEGMVGAQLAQGIATAPLHGLVQCDGSAWRIKAADLRRLLTKSDALKATLDKYLYVLMAQLATSAACLRFHEIGPRLARWLLMSQDRAHSNQFQVTQEFLAYMLGVRRVGITNAAGDLQQRELISYKRGDVAIIDRAGLEAAACGCYVDDKAAYSLLHAILPSRLTRLELDATAPESDTEESLHSERELNGLQNAYRAGGIACGGDLARLLTDRRAGVFEPKQIQGARRNAAGNAVPSQPGVAGRGSL